MKILNNSLDDSVSYFFMPALDLLLHYLGSRLKLSAIICILDTMNIVYMLILYLL